MLLVNSMFGPTIQGEGKSMGREVVFLRLSGCNLHCIWCDTPYTWNWKGSKFAHPDKFVQANEETRMEVTDVQSQLQLLAEEMREKALVISGGEPLIQQKQLLELVKYFKACGWWIEIETNGTITPLDELMVLVNQFNCSPKLANSLDSKQLRERPKALEVLSKLRTCFMKFVITSENDLIEVAEMFYKYHFDLERVFLMPEGKTAKELEKNRQMTIDLARSIGVRFSDRIHITKLGGGRLV